MTVSTRTSRRNRILSARVEKAHSPPTPSLGGALGRARTAYVVNRLERIAIFDAAQAHPVENVFDSPNDRQNARYALPSVPNGASWSMKISPHPNCPKTCARTLAVAD